MSVRSQCRLLGVNRSTFYHQPKGESAENLQIMEKMDKHIQEEPTAGALTMQSMLEDNGITINIKRVRRLMRVADITPIYPRRHLTKLAESRYIYPYLLKGLDIWRCNQVWEVDITYVPMTHGFMYLTAVIDVYSRYIYIERFWRTIKYQHIYLNPAKEGIELYAGIKKWLDRYHHRNHQGIDAKPATVYAQQQLKLAA